MFQSGLDTSATNTANVVVPLVVPAAHVGTGSVASESMPAIDLRVLHVVNGEHFSGAERVQSHLGRCLPALGVAADFASVKPGKFAKLINEQDGQWGKGYDVPMSSRFDLRPAFRVRDIALQNGYDVLHAYTPRTAMIAAIAARLNGLALGLPRSQPRRA